MSINFNLLFFSFLLFSCLGKDRPNRSSGEILDQGVDKKVEKVIINEYELSLSKKEAVETESGFCEVQNIISLNKGAGELQSFSVCTAELEDVQFVNKGYLTVIEHYSSPVGWSKYFVFDFCKKRMIETKKLDEGTEIEWASFIDFNSEFEKSTIEKITKF